MRLLKSQHVDLLITDVQMPGMDGLALLMQVRKDPCLAGLPLILISALDDRSSVRKGMFSGADDYLTKPFSAEELILTWKAACAAWSKGVILPSSQCPQSPVDGAINRSRDGSAFAHRSGDGHQGYRRGIGSQPEDRQRPPTEHHGENSTSTMPRPWRPSPSGRAWSDSLHASGKDPLLDALSLNAERHH